MKKFFKLLKAIAGWLLLALLIVAAVFALAAGIINRHPLAEGLGLALFLGALVAAAATLFLSLRWMCRGYGFRSTGIVFGGFAILFALFYAEENWRGGRAWQTFQAQSAARGEKLDFASIIPPPVPDEQNFALSPVVASCYADRLDKHGHRIDPPNTNVVNRLAMEINRDSDYDRQPTTGNWAKGTCTDLKSWQIYFRTPITNSAKMLTNDFPVAPSPQSPAADVLLALSKYDSTIEELRQASQLPFARFPINYNTENPFDSLLPHLMGTKQCVQSLRLRAEAELELGESAKALADIKLAFRMIDSMHQEPFLISHLVRIAELSIILQPVYEGLAGHKWSDGELVELERELARLDFLADYQLSMRGERNSSLSFIDHLRRHKDYRELVSATTFDNAGGEDRIEWDKIVSTTFYAFIPTGWIYLNEVTIGEMHQRWTLPTNDSSKHQIYPKVAQAADQVLGSLQTTPWNIFAKIVMPALTFAEQKFGFAQSAVDLARVAGALERYRLAHGEYPAALAAVTPTFIGALPPDVVGGEPLKYRRTEDGRFVLYSIGWNETDDGGKMALKQDGRPDNEHGDWVWQYPKK